MILNITDKYFIEKDTYCFILKERFVGEKEGSSNFGKESEKVVGYFPNITQVINELINKSLLNYDLGNDLKTEIRDTIKCLTNVVNETLKGDSNGN